jgi:hypothetical protein
MKTDVKQKKRANMMPKKGRRICDEPPVTRVAAIITTEKRKYLPTLPDLVDRLTIVQMKMIFIPERAKEYAEERALILHDIDLVLHEGHQMTAKAILAVVLISLSNRYIWENESKARAGGSEQDRLLKLTHSINGVRNTAKNMLAGEMGGRHDYKIDCFAQSLTEEFGNWNVFDESENKR